MVLSVFLSIVIFVFPQEVLEKTGLTRTTQLEFITKWVLPPWLMFFGLFITHVWRTYVYGSSQNLKHWKFYETITLTIGEYYEIKKGNDLILKITLIDISKEKMPPPYVCIPQSESHNIDTEAAILSFYPPFVYPGRCVKNIENSTLLSGKNYCYGT